MMCWSEGDLFNMYKELHHLGGFGEPVQADTLEMVIRP